MERLPVLPPPPHDGDQVALERGFVRPVSRPPAGAYIEIDSQDGDNEDELGKWLEYLYVLNRHKVAVLLAGALGLLAGLGFSLTQTPTYLASTTLEFQPSDRQPFEGVSFLNEWDPYLLQTQVQLLKSRGLQDRVSARLREEADSANTPVSSTTLGSLRGWMGLASADGTLGWEEAVAHARGGLTVTPVRDTRLVQIASSSTLPSAAAGYVNTLAEVFIEQSLDERWKLYQSTGAWLQKAQEELKTKLEESERELLEYSSQSGLVVTSKDQNIGEQKLIDLQTELSKAQADRIQKEATYRTAASRPADSRTEMLGGGPMTAYETSIADLRREMADLTTTLTAEHPKVRRLEAQIEELRSAQSREQANIVNRMRAEYETALHRERQLLTNFGEQTKVLADQDQKLIRYKMLQREADTYRQLYEDTLKTGKEASIVSALRPVNARLVDPARPPRAPSTPDVPRNLGLGLFGGVVVGIGFVLFRDRTDASIRTAQSIAPYGNLRQLGVIPSATADPGVGLPSGRSMARSLGRATPGLLAAPKAAAEPVELATWTRKGSLLAESFRGTLTSILLSGQTDDKKVILVTSPSPREGKSTVVTNLGIALAEIHKRVVIIDADLRRPRLHTIFGQANTFGLSDLLRDDIDFATYPVDALARPTHVPGLFSIPSGSGSISVSPLLYSRRMADLLGRLRQEFDAVLIDTPPVLSVADARVVSRLADAVVLVLRAGQTRREAATMAVNMFEADGIPVLGTVLNDWNARTMGSTYYPSDYQHYYSDASAG